MSEKWPGNIRSPCSAEKVGFYSKLLLNNAHLFVKFAVKTVRMREHTVHVWQYKFAREKAREKQGYVGSEEPKPQGRSS